MEALTSYESDSDSQSGEELHTQKTAPKQPDHPVKLHVVNEPSATQTQPPPPPVLDFGALPIPKSSHSKRKKKVVSKEATKKQKVCPPPPPPQEQTKQQTTETKANPADQPPQLQPGVDKKPKFQSLLSRLHQIDTAPGLEPATKEPQKSEEPMEPQSAPMHPAPIAAPSYADLVNLANPHSVYQQALGPSLPQAPAQRLSVPDGVQADPMFQKEFGRQMNFVDVSQKELTQKTLKEELDAKVDEQLSKNNEQIPALFRGITQTEFKPTGIFSRKNQITSVAARAAEWEVHLLRNKSQGQRTKRDTLQKYGWV